MIIIIGPPGSGKGTQIRELHHITKRPYFSAGDNLKMYAESHPNIKESLIKGINVDNNEINEYLINKGLDLGLNVIFDGFPRTLNQINYFLEYKYKNTIIKNIIEGIFVLEVSMDHIINRLINRNICNICNTTYSQQIICCNNTPTSKRQDDINLEVIKKRIENYHNNINILIDIYTKYNIPIHYINGEEDIHLVTKNILKYLS